jgi:hypothetical protein
MTELKRFNQSVVQPTTTPAVGVPGVSNGVKLKRFNTQTPQADTTQAPQSQGNFITNAPSNIAALFRGEVTPGQVANEIPGTLAKTAEFIAPATTKFVKTTGGILGEGLAYAIDPNVRAAVARGDKGILQTTENTTQKQLAKYTFASGLEQAIFRSLPGSASKSLAVRAGSGALEGLGFAVSTGLAEDKTPEEIIKSLPAYGIGGAAITSIAPILLPLLKKVPKDVVDKMKQVHTPVPQKLPVKSETTAPVRVPITTPNSKYEAYLRSQGYEPYIANEKLPTIDMGPKPVRPKSDLPTIQLGTDVAPKMPPPPGTRLVPDKTQTTPTLVRSEPVPTEIKPVVSTKDTNVATANRTVDVPANLAPVQSAGPATESALSKKLLSDTNTRVEYNASTNPEILARSAKAVENMTSDDIKAVLSGQKQLPEGTLYQSFYMAAAKKAEMLGEYDLARDIAARTSLQGTRFGQEVQIMKNADPLSATSNMEEIVTARIQKVARESKLKVANGKEAQYVEKKVVKEAQDAKKAVDEGQIKIDQAEALINSIPLC